MKKTFSLLLLLFPFVCFSQKYFRISADYSIKEQTPSGDQYYKGKVYYDQNFDQIIYDMQFPKSQRLVVADTQIFMMEKDEIVSRSFTPNSNRFSIFNLILSGDLQNFGLSNSNYSISNIEEANDMTIIEWKPPSALQEKMGKVMISIKAGKLYGIVLFKPNEEIMGKRFFTQYTNYEGLAFPTKITQISYIDQEEFYKVTTFKNISFNDLSSDEAYYISIIK